MSPPAALRLPVFRAPLHPKSFPHRAHAGVRPAAPEIVSGEWLLHADSRHPRPLRNSQYFPTGLSPAFALNLAISREEMLAPLPHDPSQDVGVPLRRRHGRRAPHPYVWMGPAHAKSTRLGLECEGLEVELGALPPWEEAQRK
ncbi:hypothetical protein B0H14DRAFT_3143068 [Mycena olivaceomarginata]|nr:hypothetical protein B0H14DRAFT_3143068 [Mycena olivaceomarginata]